MAKGSAPIYTVVLRNGVTVQFESNKVEIKVEPGASPDHAMRVNIKASAKNNGLSLLYSRPDQIDAIIRDTSASPPENDEENGDD